MTKTELDELKSSTKAELIQLIQDQTNDLQTIFKECEELRLAVAYRDGRIGVLKEENKKLRKENSDDREECEKLKFAADVDGRFIEWLKEENKKSEEKNREDRKKLYQEIAELQILNSPKEYMSFDRTKFFGKLSIVN